MMPNVRIARFVRALSLSGLNQAISSATSLLIGLYFVRVLNPAEFGLYGVGMALTLFYASIGSSLFLTPLVIFSASKTGETRESFARSMFAGTLAFGAGSAVLVCVVYWIASLLRPTLDKHALFTLTASIACVTYLAKEFFVRYAYSERQEVRAVRVNGAVSFVIIALLGLLAWIKSSLNASTAMSVYALGNCAGCLLGYFESRMRIGRLSFDELRTDTKQTWNSAVWGAAMTAGAALRGNALTFIGAAILGPVAVATMNVARLFVTPIHLAFPVLVHVLLPRVAARSVADRKHAARGVYQALMLTVGGALAYGVTALVAFPWIQSFVLSGKYDIREVRFLLFLFLVHAVVLALRNPIEVFLQAVRKFDVLALTHATLAVVTCIAIATILKVSTLNVGVLVFLASEVILTVWLIRAFRSETEK